eukprot:GILK01007169.1.p1 GENE.GILK01007169.1~~GILK01007169.1.p1  ORF type:complete len:223 (+),score=20.59 GILK01007169.1:44-712(+)
MGRSEDLLVSHGKHAHVDITAEKQWCHQCRAKRISIQCRYATSISISGKKSCRKSYCHSCLLRYYDERYEDVKQNRGWRCPACRGVCCCSLCSKMTTATSLQMPFDSKEFPCAPLFRRAQRLLEDLRKQLHSNHQSSVYYTPVELCLDSAKSSLESVGVLLLAADDDKLLITNANEMSYSNHGLPASSASASASGVSSSVVSRLRGVLSNAGQINTEAHLFI